MTFEWIGINERYIYVALKLVNVVDQQKTRKTESEFEK